MIVAEYTKQNYHNYLMRDLFFLRDVSGPEIDLIIQDGMDKELVEINASQTIMPDMFKGLTSFEQHSKEAGFKKSLVYSGNEGQHCSVGVVLPWNAI